MPIRQCSAKGCCRPLPLVSVGEATFRRGPTAIFRNAASLPRATVLRAQPSPCPPSAFSRAAATPAQTPPALALGSPLAARPLVDRPEPLAAIRVPSRQQQQAPLTAHGDSGLNR